jgi:hypothetical protein
MRSSSLNGVMVLLLLVLQILMYIVVALAPVRCWTLVA